MEHGILLGVWCATCGKELRWARFQLLFCDCGFLTCDNVLKDKECFDGWNSADLREVLLGGKDY